MKHEPELQEIRNAYKILIEILIWMPTRTEEDNIKMGSSEFESLRVGYI
jgi:hypothetical protein